MIADGVSTWLQKTVKFARPSALAWRMTIAVGGVPMTRDELAATAVNAAVSPIAAIPEVKAVAVKDDRVIVVVGKAPVKTSIRITGLIDSVNRKLFFGKVSPIPEQPLSMVYSYLTTPRMYAPRWFHEGMAVFLETWMGGGLGRDSALATQGEQREGNAWLAYEERAAGAWRGYYGWLPRGRHVVEYTLRLNTAGRFGLPPTRVEALYAPETFGERPNEPLEVAP